MSEKNDILTNEDATEEVAPDTNSATGKVVVKRKRFKKSDILVFLICLAVSVTVWLYASNSQKAAEDKEITDLKDAVQSGVQSGLDKNTEADDDKRNDQEDQEDEKEDDKETEKENEEDKESSSDSQQDDEEFSDEDEVSNDA